MNNSFLFIMCGIPGSGKSFFVEQNASDTSIVVSRDKIRYSLLNDNDEYFSKEKQVFKEFIREIQNGIDEGKVVYADATHLNGVSRFKLLNNLNLKNTKVVPIFFNIPLDICLQRNAQRTGRARVPDNVITKMYYSLTDPANDEQALGKNYYYNILYVEE